MRPLPTMVIFPLASAMVTMPTREKEAGEGGGERRRRRLEQLGEKTRFESEMK